MSWQCEENSSFLINLDLPYNELGEDKIIKDKCGLVQWDYTQRLEQRIYGNLTGTRNRISRSMMSGRSTKS